MKYERIAMVVKAIAHPLRLKIIMLLQKNPEMSVSEITEEVNVEQTAVSQHLLRMKLYGCLGSRRRGKFIFYSLRKKYLAEIIRIVRKINS